MDEEVLYCAICHYLMVDCVDTPCCGVGYCRECIVSYLKLSTKCPSCRASGLCVVKLRTNKLAQRIVDNFHVECVNKSDGCHDKILWGNKIVHEEKCEYAMFECIYNPSVCGKFRRKDIEDHEDKYCEFRCIHDPYSDHCYRHDKSFTLYCEDCDMYLCVECYEKKHSDHNIMPLTLALAILQIKWLNCGINETKFDAITSPTSTAITSPTFTSITSPTSTSITSPTYTAITSPTLTTPKQTPPNELELLKDVILPDIKKFQNNAPQMDYKRDLFNIPSPIL